MSEGMIDEASVFSIVTALNYKKPDECFNWAWKNALEVTATLVSTDHLKLAPYTSSRNTPSGSYGELREGLSKFISSSDPSQQIRHSALLATKRWASRNFKSAQNGFEKMKSDNTGFSLWLDWFITNAWGQHSQRHEGLFEREFIRQIAQVLDVPEKYLLELLQRSSDPMVVAEYAKKHPDTDDFRYTRDAFVISYMLRGRYHENIAQHSSWQIIHHPVRYPILPSSDGKPRIEFPLSNTERYLANIILASAFGERSPNRIACWLENVYKAREAQLIEQIDLRPKKHNDVALDLAIDTAKKVGIRAHPRWMEEVFDASATIGVGILTSFYLIPWEAFLAGTAAYFATRLKSPGKIVATALYEREKSFGNLAKAGPGRIENTWRR